MKLSLPALWLALAFTSIAIISDHASAHSTQTRPLNRISYVSDISIEAIDPPDSLQRKHSQHTRHLASSSHPPQRRSPGSLHHSDSLRLSLRAFSQQFHLHLRPNTVLLHSNGTTVRYYAFNETTGETHVEKTEKLLPGDVRAYHGVVVRPSHSKRRFQEDVAGVKRDIYADKDWGVVGRASVIVHDDGSESGTPSFEGSFDWLGNQHYVSTSHKYLSKRRNGDPMVERRDSGSNHLVVYRDSDIMTELEARDAGMETTEVATKMGCSSDSLGYNNQSHFILSDANNDDMSRSVYSFFSLPAPARFVRRDLFGGALSLFGRSMSEELIGMPEDPTRRYMYDESDEDYLVPTMGRRQATGNDVAGGDAAGDFDNSIGSTAGCPNSPQVVYVGVASDCTYTQRQGGETQTRTEILNNMNSVSNLYRSTFNVSLGVVDLDVRSPTCPSSPPSNARWNVDCGSDTIDVRLNDFSSWRAQQPANGIGVWHLMTACNSGSEIGVAWLGTLCKTDVSNTGNQVSSGTGVSSITPQQWQVMAHEIGHNFGAIHDCASGCSLTGDAAVQNGGTSCCPASTSQCHAGEQYVMNPQSRSNIQSFSQCSVGNICSLLGRGLDTSCVVSPGERATLSTEQCGNGILEPGEECDAGPNGSNCCTTECRLAPNARCDPDNSACCTQQCNFAPSSQVCRPSVDDRCDIPETCPGDSAECPVDEKKNDGDSCASGLTCANGFCTSRDQQCRSASTSQMTFSAACSAGATGDCQLSCRNPSRVNSCLILQQTFIDGTSCGNGGRCEDGECKSGSWQDTFRGWYRNNLNIAIPVTIVIGIIALLLIWALLRCCFGSLCGGSKKGAFANKRSRNKLSLNSSINNVAPTGQMAYNSTAPPPPPPVRHDRRSSRQQWVDPGAFNGPYNGGYNSYDPSNVTQPSYAPPSGTPPANGYYQTYNGR